MKTWCSPSPGPVAPRSAFLHLSSCTLLQVGHTNTQKDVSFCQDCILQLFPSGSEKGTPSKEVAVHKSSKS